MFGFHSVNSELAPERRRRAGDDAYVVDLTAG